MWLARVGRERLEEIADSSRALERGRDTYRKKCVSSYYLQGY